jgi:hypothetical protein
MSQIDKIIYLPLLFRFIILIIFLYSIIFTIFLSQILSINKIRYKYINKLLKISQIINKFIKYINKILYIYIVKFKNMKMIKVKNI